jgi:apolipoprotein N-acyltransferase
MSAGRRNSGSGGLSSLLPAPSSLAFSLIVAFFLGAVSVFGFAPYYVFPLPVLTLAELFYMWSRAQTPRAAAATGFAYGLGLFLFGVSWVYVSLHDFGAMPAPLAAVATFLFCAFLALFPAAAGYACAKPAVARAVRYGLLAPAAWTLTEWTRGWIFTGFPWLAYGYSQVPSSALSGYAPVLGIYGVSLAVALSAGILILIWQRATERPEGRGQKAEGKSWLETFILHPSSFTRRVVLHRSTLLLILVWLAGWALKQVEWTEAVGPPLKVSLLQGNIPQDLKWREDKVLEALEIHRALAMLSRSPLIVLPETALPLFLEQAPREYLSELAGHARRNGGDILIGVPERLPGGEYFNSVVSFGSAPTQTYRKSHLVPFGEFIPLRPLLGWIVGVLAIPLQDFSRGAEDQRPLAVAGQRVAVNICYEDAFGEEIIRQLPEATLLVNVSNVAWFGRSIAPRQHLQISQARALETGRSMLRATNTGITGVVGPNGELKAAAPEFSVATVTHLVQGYGGATPYVRWGNAAALVLCMVAIAAAVAIQRYTARSAA